MAMEVQLRPVDDVDRSFLYALHVSTMRGLIEEVWGWDEEWQRNDFNSRVERCRVAIIEVEEIRCGAVFVEPQSEATWIADLQVLPEHQGRGIGTAVLRQLMAEASNPVALSVLQMNHRARRLYERLGFVVTATVEPFLHMQYPPSGRSLS